MDMSKDAWENILSPPCMMGMCAILGPSLHGGQQRSFQPPNLCITFFNITWSLHRVFDLYQGTSRGISSVKMSLERK